MNQEKIRRCLLALFHLPYKPTNPLPLHAVNTLRTTGIFLAAQFSYDYGNINYLS